MKTRNDCEIACDCFKRANAVLHVGLCKEIFARKHTATHKPTSACSAPHSDHEDTHTHTYIYYSSVEPLGLRPSGAIKCLHSHQPITRKKFNSKNGWVFTKSYFASIGFITVAHRTRHFQMVICARQKEIKSGCKYCFRFIIILLPQDDVQSFKIK